MKVRDWGRLRDQSIVVLTALVLLAVLLWLLGHVIGVVALVAVALVLALVLEPLMALLERYMPRLAAASLIYVVVLGIVVGLAIVFWPLLRDQALGLLRNLPSYIGQADAYAEAQAPRLGLRLVSHPVTDLLARVGATPEAGVGTALQVAADIVGVTAAVGCVLVLAFYFMVDGQRMRDGIVGLLPQEHELKARFLEETVRQVLGAYIRSQLIMAALVGAVAGFGCWLLGVPYPAVIGVLVFFAELVPLIGPFLGAVPAMLIASFQSFPLLVEVTFFFVIMQVLDQNVVRPRIIGPMVGLHPVEALLALVVGVQVAGLGGALFAVPVVGIAVVLVSVSIKAWRGEPLEHEREGMKLTVIDEEEKTSDPPAASPARRRR